MSSARTRDANAHTEPRTLLVADADSALLLSIRAWGTSEPESPESLLGRWLAADWQDRLLPARERIERLVPAEAVEQLRSSLHWQRRVRLDQVHPSWIGRALQDETLAVRKRIASGGLTTENAIDTDSESWAFTLWTERLVGGEPVHHDDAQAIMALANPARSISYRLCYLAGLAKVVIAGPSQEKDRDCSVLRERRKWFSDRLGILDARVGAWAARDLVLLERDGLPNERRRIAQLGLTTMARLLADADPFRVRWALQHLPYPIAKRIRTLMPPLHRRSMAISELESLILKTAWERLTLEERIGQMPPTT
jgi:hypothetical protein